jgi:hypothetical protein
MGDRFCPNCGTEVEADARFCPSCGTTLSLRAEEESPRPEAAELPAAPAWPPPDDQATRVESAVEPEPEAAPAPEPQPDQELEPEARPAAAEEPDDAVSAGPPPPPALPAPAVRGGSTAGGGLDLPITWPTTLSGWLIGGGSLLGALALTPRLGNVVSLLLFLALVGVAATVFLAERVPDMPRQRLAILAVSMVGLGIGLARAGFSVQGADTVFLVAMLAAAGGALLIELDRDRPLPPPSQRA